jgi:DNA-binding FadR family transcriptional regulator
MATRKKKPQVSKDPKPSPNRSVTEKIFRWLNQQIETGKLGPSAKLPSESELCERFSVGRSTVREALSQLRSEGIVYAQQGRGVFVSERGTRQTFRLRSVSIDDAEGIQHVIELLVTFESAAARIAAKRRTQEDIKRIKQALFQMEYAIVHDELGDEEDFAFHQAIVDATRNPHFKALNDYLEQHIRRLIRRARSNTAANYADLIQAVQDEHKAIFSAIEAGDALTAGNAAEVHLRNAAKRLNTYLQC